SQRRRLPRNWGLATCRTERFALRCAVPIAYREERPPLGPHAPRSLSADQTVPLDSFIAAFRRAPAATNCQFAFCNLHFAISYYARLTRAAASSCGKGIAS